MDPSIQRHPGTVSFCVTYIASEVLLLAQDSLIPVQLNLEPSDEFGHERLVGLLTKAGFDHLFVGNHTSNRVELRILDTCSLLELGDRAGISRHQLWASSERDEVAADGP
jgi:hypothetical protein